MGVLFVWEALFYCGSARRGERMRNRWIVKEINWQEAAALAEKVNVSPLLGAFLLSRGLLQPEEAHRFLNPSLDQLGDPMKLPDAEPAIRRLLLAKEKGERVLIYGDYDADGVTSTTLWTLFLRKLGIQVEPFVPHREREGYDLQNRAVDLAKEQGASLILTCDCGTRAVDVVEHAREHSIDVVITDHHAPGSALPRAVAVVNPQRVDSDYPYPHLCGAGVSFRLGEGMMSEMSMPVANYRRAFLDLVTIGTVSDIMPLTGENRAMVAHGLPLLANTRKLGLQKLLTIIGHTPGKELEPSKIGFQIGPRLNAAGRIDHANLALDLLLSENETEAETLAATLNDHNKLRQEIQDQITREAIAQIEAEELYNHKIILVKSPDWQGGVIGIVASRLMRDYYRPIFITTLDKESGMARGSIRSVSPVDIRPLLEYIEPLCDKCGGHKAAGGFSIRLERLSELEQALIHWGNLHIQNEQLLPTLEVDMEIQGRTITPEFVQELSALAPFGHGNPAPQLLCRQARVVNTKISKSGEHLMMVLASGDRQFSAVAWGRGNTPLKQGDSLDVVFTPEMDTYNNDGSVRWNVTDFRIANPMFEE